MGHTYTNLLTHVIFSTKGRVAVLNTRVKQRLFPYMGGVVCELGGVAVAINGPPDHVHLLMFTKPKLSISEVVGKVKSRSTNWIHREFTELSGFAWQTGYAAFSVSHSQRQAVINYIRNQEEHHRVTSFKEELVAFFKRQDINFQELYLWD